MNRWFRYCIAFLLLVLPFGVSGCASFQGKKVIEHPVVKHGAALALHQAMFHLLKDRPGTDFDLAHRIVDDVADAIQSDGTYDWERIMGIVDEKVPFQYQAFAYSVLTPIRVEVQEAVAEGDHEGTRRLVAAMVHGAHMGMNEAKTYQMGKKAALAVVMPSHP